MKNNILLLVMFIFGSQLTAQAIPVQYQNQEKYPHYLWDGCGIVNLARENLMVKPFQPLEMVLDDEITMYNKIKNSKPNFFVQGVLITNGYTFVMFTYKSEDGTYHVNIKQYQYWVNPKSIFY